MGACFGSGGLAILARWEDGRGREQGARGAGMCARGIKLEASTGLSEGVVGSTRGGGPRGLAIRKDLLLGLGDREGSW